MGSTTKNKGVYRTPPPSEPTRETWQIATSIITVSTILLVGMFGIAGFVGNVSLSPHAAAENASAGSHAPQRTDEPERNDGSIGIRKTYPVFIWALTASGVVTFMLCTFYGSSVILWELTGNYERLAKRSLIMVITFQLQAASVGGVAIFSVFSVADPVFRGLA